VEDSFTCSCVNCMALLSIAEHSIGACCSSHSSRGRETRALPGPGLMITHDKFLFSKLSSTRKKS
jgi:hypothetical protein